MSQEVELIQLSTSDDAASVKDRLAFLRGRSVLLVWPESGTTLTRRLDLVLIQREAKRLAIRLALVTHDPDVKRHAAELNISAFETVGASARSKWRRGQARTFINRNHRPEDAPEPDELMPIASRIRVESADTPLSRLVRWVVRALLLLVLTALALALTYLLVPGAVVSVSLRQETLTVSAEITADPNSETGAVNIERGEIPALRLQVEVEERGSIPTSGTQQLGSVPARGTVVFINKTERAVEIPADLVITSSSAPEVFFRTLQSASVPAGLGLQIEVPVEALPNTLGENGNVGAGALDRIIGALADQVDVRNVAPMTGGISSAVRAVTQADRDSLLATLRQQLQTRAYAEMLPQLSASQFIIPETIGIVEERADWTVFDHAVGDAADTLTLTMRAVVEAVVVDEIGAQQIAFSRIASRVPPGWVIRQIDFERAGMVRVDETGKVSFTMNASAFVQAPLDVGRIREQLAGRSISEAEAYLRQQVEIDTSKGVEVRVSPDWLGQMPLLPLRIAVRVVDQP
jgi:hypothetical protein